MTDSLFKHIPVLKTELINSLNLKDGDTVVDCTAGLGGHIEAIIEQYNDIKVIAIDKDEEVIPFLMNKFKDNKNVIVVNADYQDIDNIIGFFDIEKVNAVYADLGFSSYQINKAERGFSFQDAPLDMRFSKEQEFTAYDLIHKSSYEELKKIFKEYGDERLAAPIASRITNLRELRDIKTTSDLRKIVHSVYAKKKYKRTKIDSATKVFQAIRIAVNNEFETIKKLLNNVEKVLYPNGRFSVISFHSGEDRIVKKIFNNKVNACTCPSDFPKCVCGNVPSFRWIQKTPITAKEEEISFNPRSRSAKMRVLEKI